MNKLIIFLFAAVVIFAAPLAAQASSDENSGSSAFIYVFYPQVHFRGENQLDDGNGLGISIGGMKAEVFGAYLTALRTRHDDGFGQKADFTGLTWDLKVALPLFKYIVPYGSAGLGRYVLERSQTVYRGNREGSGINGYQVGAGLEIHLSDYFSINGGYTKRRLEFDSQTPGVDDTKHQIREFDFGLAFHFH